MSYANMDGVTSQSEGVSEVLASDWNTYVRDNFDSIKFGHIVCESTSRPLGVAEGTMIYETDTNKVLVYDGSSWRPTGNVDIATSTTRPGTTFEGQVLYETDSNKLLIYDGSSWKEISDLDNSGSVSDASLNYAPQTIVSSLPGSPVDGQIVHYQNSAMASQSVVWKFRYRSGGGTYKWEFIGGGPLSYTSGTSEWIVSGGTGYSGTILTIPLSGIYVITIKNRWHASIVGNQMLLYVVNSGGTANLFSSTYLWHIARTIDEYETDTATGVHTISSQSVRFAFEASNNQGRSYERYFSILPVAV